MPASRTAEDRKREMRALEDVASSRILAAIIRNRLRFFPLPLALSALLVYFFQDSWRWALIAFAALSIAGLGVVESVRVSRAGPTRDLLLPVWLGGVAQLGVVLVLGGIAGPIAPALPLITVVMNLLAPGRQALYFVLFVQLPAVWAFAFVHAYDLIPGLVPEAWDGLFVQSGTPGHGPWFGAGFLTMILVGATMMGRLLRRILMSMLREQLEDRDRELEQHEASARELSQMTAEIAHELKNPLASIKGLAALVRKDLSGQTAERMDVLRREVDRLQGILEEFLSYSRPLVPLDEERVDLAELAREVIDLHEGTATSRGVRLVPPSDDEAHLRCDPRKIKQVLINLVQNAIEASARGGEVRVEIERDVDGARVRVIDAGSGLAEGAEERLFTVGFTTKDEGSGIGLALARGLARQHGGELTLEARPDARGCVATLRLPHAPVAPETQAAATATATAATEAP